MQQVLGKTYYQREKSDTIPELLAYAIKQYPDQPAYRYRLQPDGPDITKSYLDLQQDIYALGTALLARGCTLGEEYLVTIGDNCYEWAITHNTALFGLGVSVPLDRQLPVTEAVFLSQRGKASLFCFHENHLEIARAAARELPGLKYLIALQPDVVTPELQAEDPRFVSLQVLLAEGQAQMADGARTFMEAKVSPTDLASLVFTSGTTALSKGVLLSQANIAENVYSAYCTINLPPRENALSVLPLHHTFENTVGMYTLWAFGCCIHFNAGLRYLARHMQEWQIGIIIGVPLLVENIYRNIQKNLKKQGKLKLINRMRLLTRGLLRIGIDVRRRVFAKLLAALGGKLHLIVSGAAALDPKVAEFFNDIGIRCWAGYGLTEAAPVVSVCNEYVGPLGSVGPPLAFVEVAIDSPALGFGPEFQGEILVRGKNVMLGYYDDPAATDEVILQDGWLRTGDIGYIDETDSIFITGRAKSMIVLANGKKAFPEEIETLLNRIPGIKNSMAWGEVNPREAVDVCARLQIEPDELPAELSGADDQAIADYLHREMRAVNQQMPSYKAVKYFIWGVSDFVMTTTLKVKRPAETRIIHDLLEHHGLTMREAHGRRLENEPAPEI